MSQDRDSLTGRIGRLEAQIDDLKVTVGTLESLLRANPGAALSPGPGSAPITDGDLGARVAALETQIGALTSQIEIIGKQMSALEARLSGAPQSLTPLPQAVPSERQGQAPDPASGSDWDAVDTSEPRWFGPRPGEEAILGAETGPQSPVPQGDAEDTAGEAVAALPASKAQSLYREAYAELLQRDYPAAETSFRRLVETYPRDPLAGSAQYWLGETYYRRGQYKDAADAFLTGYKKYGSSDKAPDTLLKLGMALAELGQKEAACSTFDEFGEAFPKAPKTLADEGKAARKKTGC